MSEEADDPERERRLAWLQLKAPASAAKPAGLHSRFKSSVLSPGGPISGVVLWRARSSFGGSKQLTKILKNDNFPIQYASLQTPQLGTEGYVL